MTDASSKCSFPGALTQRVRRQHRYGSCAQRRAEFGPKFQLVVARCGCGGGGECGSSCFVTGRTDMRWSHHGAHKLMQVRTAEINGELHERLRQPFRQPQPNVHSLFRPKPSLLRALLNQRSYRSPPHVNAREARHCLFGFELAAGQLLAHGHRAGMELRRTLARRRSRTTPPRSPGRPTRASRRKSTAPLPRLPGQRSTIIDGRGPLNRG